MYLVDTNIWLERLLDQAQSEEVGQFLERVSHDRLYVSDFTLHSIGIILSVIPIIDSRAIRINEGMGRSL